MTHLTSAINAMNAGSGLSKNVLSSAHSNRQDTANVAKEDRINDSVEPEERDSNGQLTPDEFQNLPKPVQIDPQSPSITGQNLDLFG